MSGQSSRARGAPGVSPARRIEHRRQRLGVELDQRCGVLGDSAGLRHDERDGLADVADLLVHEREGVDVKADRTGGNRERDAIGGKKRAQVGIAEHGVHAGDGARLRRVDPAQPRMRDRAAQHRDVEQAGQFYVVDEAGGAAQQRNVLDARHRATKQTIVIPPARIGHAV